jgi:hypothetical protein
VAENGRPARGDGRIRLLTSTYGAIAARYDELEALSVRQRDLLSAGRAMSEVQALLARKRDLLNQIRAEEEGVAEMKTWWARARRTLPPVETRELMDVLDSVSRRIERALSLEAECRALLASRSAFRAAAPSVAGAALSARSAYARERARTGEAR